MTQRVARVKISLLSDAQIQRLHEASLRILATVGVHVPHEEMLRLLAEAGAEVDYCTQLAKLPENLVMASLAAAGRRFAIYGRDRGKQAEFGAGKRNYNTTAGQAHWLEPDLRRRPATLEDVRTASRFGDALPWINIVGAMSDPHELPPSYRCVVVAAELLKNATKPIMFWFHDRASARFILELFTIVAGRDEEASRYPFAYPFLEPISPLRFPRNGIDLLFETCRFNLPVPVGPMAQTGATAPGTLAGTLAQENAEILAGICLVQQIGPGTPVCYGGIPHVFDMRTTQLVFAGPEQAIMAVAMTEMGKFYGLPVYINVGLTDSKVPDAQAGLEAGITLACGALAGADIFGHFGICGVDQASSLDMLVMQHEAIGYVERLLGDLEISEETLGLEVLARARDTGSFLAEEHTVRHFRRELWFPQLLDRRFFQSWADDGKKDMAARCREMKDRILREHMPVPLDDGVCKAVDKLVEDARRHLTR
jgi:trimethylamine--corrinoid protein Co-methyltransferase